MHKSTLFVSILALFLAFSLSSCSKKYGCPGENSTGMEIDRKSNKSKSGISGKDTKYKRKRR